MNSPLSPSALQKWTDHTRVPFSVYTDPDIYRLELERIFYGPFWQPVALVAEIPEVGDYKTFYIGETPVIVTHTGENEFHTMVNACSHRGVELTSEFLGKATDFTCPYHGWVFDNKGTCHVTPGEERFRTDFDKKDYGLTQLRTTVWSQVVWATFDPATPPMDEFLGDAAPALRNALGGGERPLQLLGYQKITFNCNWKIYMDNDGYHAGLLHTAFRLLDFQGGKGTMISDGTGGHWGIDYGTKPYEDNGYLNDASVVETRNDELTATVNLIRPLCQSVKHLNSINFRFGRPVGPDKTEVHYTYLGFADDDDAIHNHRIRQSANLLGPSGFVSIEDSAVFERVQKAVSAPGNTINFVKGLAESPDGKRCMQNDEAGSTPWWNDYKQRMGL